MSEIISERLKKLIAEKRYSKAEISERLGIGYSTEGIKDLVNFESETVEGIIKEFHSAVDDYLVFCEEVGKFPDMPQRIVGYT